MANSLSYDNYSDKLCYIMPCRQPTYLAAKNSKDIRRVCSGNSQVSNSKEEEEGVEDGFVITQGMNVYYSN